MGGQWGHRICLYCYKAFLWNNFSKVVTLGWDERKVEQPPNFYLRIDPYSQNNEVGKQDENIVVFVYNLVQNILRKIAKWCKVRHLLLHNSWAPVPKICFCKGSWTLATECPYAVSRFSYNFLNCWDIKSWVVWQFLRQLIYQVNYKRSQVLFYLWRMEILLKLCKFLNIMNKFNKNLINSSKKKLK